MDDQLYREGIHLGLVARRQRFLLWCILALLLLYGVGPFGVAILGPTAGPIALIVNIIAILALELLVLMDVVAIMAAVRIDVVSRIICGVLMFVPGVNLIILLCVNHRANRVLRRAGIRVGLMGVADETVRRRLMGNLCRECGYNLTGNVSGVCPECGTTVVFVDSPPV